MTRLKHVSGKPVVGDEFWDRENETALFIERIRDGAHLLLVAQRRMGKTSLMREVKRRLEEERLCLFLDVQKATCAEDFIVELSVATLPHAKLWEKTRALFGNLWKAASKAVELQAGDVGVRLRGGLDGGNWMERGDRLFDVLAESERPVVLFVDELPIFVNRVLKGSEFTVTPERRELAEQFLSWLRANSLRVGDKVSLVVAGSVGLEPVLRQAQLSATANTLESFELGPWSKDVAVACLEALARDKGLTLEAGAAPAMVEKLGYCVPHHVQMFFGAVLDTCRRRGDTHFRVAEVDELYKTRMLSVRGTKELAHYEERLRFVLGNGSYERALELLTETAVVGTLRPEALRQLAAEPPSPDEASPMTFAEILRVLEHDGYLRQAPEGYVFVSDLLKDWWAARNSFGYVPVLERNRLDG